MRIQSTASYMDRMHDAYFTSPEAIWSLLAIEKGQIPQNIWEPAAGDGAIVRPMLEAGYKVIASDLIDYGLANCASGRDYLQESVPPGVQGIVTNPPYNLAKAFTEKAIQEVSYLALLLRTNFLESMERFEFFQQHPPSRIWIAYRRLPMMHRRGYEGPKAPSNTCHAWFVWDNCTHDQPLIKWFDWKEHATRSPK